MRPLRIAHVSDTHLGYRALFKTDPVTGRNQRSIDIERAYERVIDDILERDVDLVLHAGDVFHHTRPSWTAIKAFVKQTKRLVDHDIPGLVIAGNHDTPRLRASGSVFSVAELALPGIEFVTDYQQRPVEFPDLDLVVLAIPHGQLADPLPASASTIPGTRNILLTHGLVSGVNVGKATEPGEEIVQDYLLLKEFDYIALGDYHLSMKVRSNAWYSGSTERIGWGDYHSDPGYLLVEFEEGPGEPAITHIPIATRPMKMLAPVDSAEKSAREIADIVLQRLERDAPPDGMARVELREATRPARREAESILRREAADLVWSLEIKSPHNILAPFGEVEPALDVSDVFTLFDEYVASRQFPAEFEAAFKTKGRRALEIASQKIELAATVEESAS
jgi:DNA repair exonuclease SbcCD nuclease subunit